MTRQVVMVFYGQARWNDRHEERGAHGDVHPHESPAIMLLPLVVLAGLSLVGGAINLPFTHETEKLAAWLEPVVGRHESLTAKVSLAVIATVAGVLGIIAAYFVYARRRVEPVEPELLARGWYYDWAITRFMGGPGRRAFEAVAWYDANVVDGAVDGAGRLVRGTAQKLRPAHSGNVRNYAAGISLAVVGLLVWFVVVRGNL
jgi:NADH-quinone oxidoreductase subunit L